MYLVPYMPSAAHALGALCHTCSCASFLTCSRASRVLHVFVPHETYTLPVLGMLARAWGSPCSCAPRHSLAAGVSSLAYSYACPVLQLSCLVPLVLLVH